MIFVTVGTHEQQFNRLIQEIDRLKKENVIKDEVFIQIGYSTYEPQYCKWKKLLSYSEMNEMYEKADIIITHGGPASFMKALELKKIPIVVPRQVKYEEHINDHQVEFVKFVEERLKNIIGVYEIDGLEKELSSYSFAKDKLNQETISNNIMFNNSIERTIENIFEEAKR
ncbi:MAG: hypothetical protein KHY88_09585 [Erysipelotrichaceae bacterium]|nr:hypothetical protein [Erysipelotrichaceae bacterium]